MDSSLLLVIMFMKWNVNCLSSLCTNTLKSDFSVITYSDFTLLSLAITFQSLSKPFKKLKLFNSFSLTINIGIITENNTIFCVETLKKSKRC